MARIQSRGGRIALGLLLVAALVGLGGASHLIRSGSLRDDLVRIEICENATCTVLPLDGHSEIVVKLVGEDTTVGATCKAELALVSAGIRPLELKLERLSCECVHRITLNGAPLVPRQAVVLEPGSVPAVLQAQWLVQQEDLPKFLPTQSGRITLLLRTNDPNRRWVHVEIATELRS
jgi:hypothetical protein